MFVKKASITQLDELNKDFEQMGMISLSTTSFQDPFRNIYVLMIETEIVAFVCFLLMKDIELEAIYVKPRYRKLGYGTIMMQKLFEIALENHCESIFLEVCKSNEPAQKLYSKFGFQIISCRKHYYGTEDAYVMKKEW